MGETMRDPSPPRRRGGIPEASSDEARRRMQFTRQRGTDAEQAFCAELDALGLVYETDRSPVPGTRSRADVVFEAARVAVFIDGCFWHGCPVHATFPKSNREWWRAKLDANRQRDERANQALTDAGWLVLRFWEHEDPREAALMTADRVAARLGHGAGWSR